MEPDTSGRWRYFLPAAMVASGPAVVAAQSGGAFDGVSDGWMMTAGGALLSLVGTMAGIIVAFVRREHRRMDTMLASLQAGMGKNEEASRARMEKMDTEQRERMHKLTSTITALSLTLEQHAGHVHAELEKRMLRDEAHESSGRLHEKVNKALAAIAHMRGTMGLSGITDADDNDAVNDAATKSKPEHSSDR